MSYKVIGHRGDKANFTENTLLGFESSLMADGVDGIELDVVVSKDKQLVISHDMFTTDMKNTRHNIYDLSYEELLNIDKLSNKKSKNLGVRYPLLEELLRLYKDKAGKKILLLEVKSLPALKTLPLSISELMEQIHKLLEKYGIEEKCTIISFDYRIIEESYKQNPKYPIGLILHRNFVPLSCMVDTLNLSLLVMEKGWISKEQVLEMAKINIKIFSWTPNTEEDWRHLEDIGVKGMIMDNPQSLAEYKR